MQTIHELTEKESNKIQDLLKIPLEKEEYHPPRAGSLLLQGLVVLLFFVFVVRFWYLQVHKGEAFSEQAQQNRLRKESILAPRGTISDALGVVLADNVLTYGLTIVREDCPDIPATLAQVSAWTGINQKELTEKYRKDRRKAQSFDPILLATNLDMSLVARIEAQLLHWPGLEIVTLSQRTYPKGALYAHILGYVAEVNEEEMEKDETLAMGDLIGKQGLELVLEPDLRGKKGLYQLEVDVIGRSLSRQLLKESRGGTPIQLTLDSSMQMAAWNALEGQTGSVIVMEPDSGRLVALVTTPSYDNNLFTDGISHKEWNALRDNERAPLQNRAIQSMYPPGSVWKLMMAGLFLEAGINPKTRVHCSGSVKLGNQTFRCWKRGGHGHMNMNEALKHSCDVYFYHYGEQLGIDKIADYALKSGFGADTGILLPHEKGGLVPTREWKMSRFGESWMRGETLNISIGQGFTLVTPLQMATYVSALLNGGELLRPQLLSSKPREVMSTIPANAAIRDFIVESMRKTVLNGTAKIISRKDADMGGKTGTAQVVKLQMRNQAVIKNKDLPYNQRDHAWIATWGAKDAKRYVVIVMVEHGGGGSTAAGPVAKKVYDALFGEEEKEVTGNAPS